MHHLSRNDIQAYLEGRNDEALFALAAAEKKRVFGNDIFIRAVIEFSNHCNKRCQYCGLRSPNKEVARYRMPIETMLDAAEIATQNEVGTIVLQSGDDFRYTTEDIGELVKRIRERHDVAITLSVGDRGIDEYAYWKDCGADRCLVKLETTDSDLYAQYRMGESFSQRLERVDALRKQGYEVGSGIIVGLPGMNVETTLNDILFLSNLDLDMIAAGPFVPNPLTPFANDNPGSISLSHRVTALLRLLNPGSNIPATSALTALRHESQGEALLRGCNVLMPSMTPEEHRRDYNIYPGKNRTHATATASLAAARNTIESLGLVPSSSKGFSKRIK
ncbi:[FeFe] hydrogenase H-cluster radical SAM maturase HydE [Pseudodesulfovibrio sp. zrk46]|uniref:[FeFe] hydrogenase H-cluster radical SAM maturase HydE n=1 Tax=Pseudodesulfovibrio sp. zrk46 TaxID=2725288 RepID=UPI001448E938|nr:[FeFe] hydrogenase H-cluster radical SAM maturase HydE [Pseudodesulfovibrio sp. zrk46]QJB57549.1 [FeFe] hydrogenase H-cluster radical SAM maturase HydE [Pseudodesulfovibrio sp. zrk46]